MKDRIATVLYRLGVVHAWALLRRLFGVGGPIFLMGHRVLPASAAADPVDRMALLSTHAITPEEMERRLRFVQRWVMPAGDPADLAQGLPARRAFYLTFDDGYIDNVRHAAPVLDRLGIRAVIFFVADLVRRPEASPWWDRWGAEALAEHGADAAARYGRRCGEMKKSFGGLEPADLAPGTRRYLDAGELQALPATFFVANHTRAHANLAALPADEARAHIEQGAVALTGHPRYLPVLAFPFGAFNDAVLGVVRRAGCALAFATGNGRDGDPLCQRRINLNVASFPRFAMQCVGLMR